MNQNGTLNEIGTGSDVLTIHGGAGYDVLTADDTGETANDSGRLSAVKLTGLGIEGEIDYGTIEDIHVHLGQANDAFAVDSTITGTTTIEGRGGNDTISVLSITGPTAIYGDAGTAPLIFGTHQIVVTRATTRSTSAAKA